MLKNFLKSTLRNLVKHKTYSIINVAGLAIGLTCAILILLWVQDELSVDRYHKNTDNMCQAYLKGSDADNTGYQSTIPPVVAGMLKDEFPEIIDAARVRPLSEQVLKTGETRIVESNGIAADPEILNIMTFYFISGDPATALNNPASIILTKSLAKKYFGGSNISGKVLRINNQHDLQVTAVIEDLPLNAYRSFDYMVPFEFLNTLNIDTEGELFANCSFLTYALVQPGTSVQQLSDKVSEQTISEGETVTFEIVLQPFADAYLLDTGGNKRITILLTIALIVLGIACINYMNLSTARSSIRAREIGVRKVSGASRTQIAGQFLAESVFLALLSGFTALGIVTLLLRSFNQITGKHLALNLLDPVFIFGFLAVIIITGLIAGLYPALYVSGFHPIGIFKPAGGTAKKAAFRKLLIVTQFVFSIGFIIVTLITGMQMNYIKNFNLGVNENNIVYVRLDGDVRNQYGPLKQKLLQDPNISHVTTASNLPIAIRSGSFFIWGLEDNKNQRICDTVVGYDFPETFDLEMARGRFFSKDFGDKDAIVVNETALELAGLKDAPINSPFFYGRMNFNLVGVVKDFHHNKTLTRKPDPLAFRLTDEASTYLFAKIRDDISDAGTITATVNHIDDVCNEFSPERPLECRFMSSYSYQYTRNQEMVKKLITWSAIMSIFISCMGLFGLAAFINEQRTKEVGIRKVLGASVKELLVKSLFEFSKWVLIANIIAWPIAWFTVQNWLQNFAYRIQIHWWVFALAGVSALGFAVLTLLWQSLKTANANPIDALRYE